MSIPSDPLYDILDRRPLVLDGATGTELERRGVSSPLPLWSAGALTSHPEVVEAIHREYVDAGAEIVVANTFRTNVRTLRAAGMLERGEELNRVAIDLARRAAQPSAHRQDAGATPIDRSEAGPPNVAAGLRTGRDHRQDAGATLAHRQDGDAKLAHRQDAGTPWVAASVAPVEDCYRPDRVPHDTVLDEEHGQMLAWLDVAGPDLIWIETMGTVREARAAARATHAASMPFVVSLVVRETGELLGGEGLEDAVAAVEPFEPLAIGLNCIPPDGMTALLPRLRSATQRPLVAYAHINNIKPIFGWSYAQTVTPAEYAEHARRWLDLGARIVGGCCGTTPAHIRAVRDVVDDTRTR